VSTIEGSSTCHRTGLAEADEKRVRRLMTSKISPQGREGKAKCWEKGGMYQAKRGLTCEFIYKKRLMSRRFGCGENNWRERRKGSARWLAG